MSSEDKCLDRRAAYSEYIRIMTRNNGKHTEDSLQKLKEAFDVTEDDIMAMANDVTLDSHIDVRTARFTLMMEDLRDYRDTSQIKASRKDILKAAVEEDKLINEGYIFLG